MTTFAELQRQLDAARAELQEFTYSVSHDLRAPLRHINAFAQVIVEDWPDMPADVAGHLATIRQSAQLLALQLDGLTILSRLGQQTLQLQAVDVAALAQEVADDLSAQHAQQTVHWQLARDVPKVLADATLLRQLLLHLLDNALKFSKGREAAAVTLTWQRGQGGQCQMSVADEGVGFAPEQRDKLFKVFGKLHSARDYPGLGLGLVSSRKIIERLGGSIDIKASLNGGCCVTFDLPLALV